MLFRSIRHYYLGDPEAAKKAAEAAFAKAHAVAEVSIVNPRVITNFMETRAAVAEYDAKRDHLTLTIGSQGSHRLREILCGMVLKMPMAAVLVMVFLLARVISYLSKAQRAYQQVVVREVVDGQGMEDEREPVGALRVNGCPRRILPIRGHAADP